MGPEIDKRILNTIFILNNVKINLNILILFLCIINYWLITYIAGVSQ